MKCSKTLFTAAVLALGLWNAEARAEVYNCDGVWTTKACGNAKPVTNLPKISRTGSFEAPQAPAREAEARGALQQGLGQARTVEPAGPPRTSVISPVKSASPGESLAGLEKRIDTLSRSSSVLNKDATRTQREQLRLRSELDSICSYISSDPDLNFRYKRQCTDLNVRLEKIGQ